MGKATTRCCSLFHEGELTLVGLVVTTGSHFLKQVTGHSKFHFILVVPAFYNLFVINPPVMSLSLGFLCQFLNCCRISKVDWMLLNVTLKECAFNFMLLNWFECLTK